VARRRRSPIQTSGDQIQNRLSDYGDVAAAEACARWLTRYAYGRPWHEAHRICDRSSDQATAARTIVELKAEIETLKFVGRNEVEAPDFSRIYSDHVRRVLDQASSDHDRIRLSSLQRNAPQILPSCWMVGPTCSPIATSHRRNVVSDTSRILNTEASQQGPPQGRAQSRSDRSRPPDSLLTGKRTGYPAVLNRLSARQDRHLSGKRLRSQGGDPIRAR
jgi:hypothetical protein